MPVVINVNDLFPGIYFIKIKYLGGLESMCKLYN
jgi:hypothetical protein